MRAIFASLLLVAACGGKSTPAPAEPTGEAQPEHHEGEQHHHELPAELTAFHDVLAPLWHADAGQERTDQTCAAVPSFLEKSAAITSGPVPAGADEEAWWNAAAALQATVNDLEESCDAGAAEFDTAFHHVHEAFHGLMELLPKGEA